MDALALFLFIAAIIVAGRLVARLFSKKTEVASRTYALIPISTKPDHPQSFGYKCTWLAVRGNDQASIVQGLGLGSHTQCDWKAGIERAYHGDEVFITPEIDGWTLVVGWGSNIEAKGEGLVRLKAVLSKLSTRCGEAQFFSTHRVAEYHCWMRSVNGALVRAYAFVGESGENLIVEGLADVDIEPTRLINTLSEEAKTQGYFERDDIEYPTEDLVMRVAAAWSVDPTTLTQRTDLPEGLGLLCQ